MLAVSVFAVCDDLAAKENELDVLLSICTSSITTLTRNASSSRYPFLCVLIVADMVGVVYINASLFLGYV